MFLIMLLLLIKRERLRLNKKISTLIYSSVFGFNTKRSNLGIFLIVVVLNVHTFFVLP